MNDDLFILAGNGTYVNRGCEAILRGTAKILRHYFGKPKLLVVSFYLSNKQLAKEINEEIDDDIIHKRTLTFGKIKPVRLLNRILLKCLNDNSRPKFVYRNMIPQLKKSRAVLSLGGDNYSFDYGKPTLFVDLDNLVLSKDKPIIIWGASVGPFSKDKKYENYIKEHLKKVTGIFARDPLTVEYLNSIGVSKNVYRVADPAFLLDPIEPADSKIDKKKLEGSIGLNLSPLMSKFVTGGNSNEWTIKCANIVRQILNENKKPICFVTHVTDYRTNDYDFMKKVLSLVSKEENDMIYLLPNNLNAGETKWAISKMSIFVGSRTHALISALSSAVPAISLTYSIKGKGIIRDIYGDDYFSIESDKLVPEIISNKVSELIRRQEEIRGQIKLVLPKIEELAMSGGKYLKQILDDRKI